MTKTIAGWILYFLAIYVLQVYNNDVLAAFMAGGATALWVDNIATILARV